jgi:hypothetical protein
LQRENLWKWFSAQTGVGIMVVILEVVFVFYFAHLHEGGREGIRVEQIGGYFSGSYSVGGFTEQFEQSIVLFIPLYAHSSLCTRIRSYSQLRLY